MMPFDPFAEKVIVDEELRVEEKIIVRFKETRPIGIFVNIYFSAFEHMSILVKLVAAGSFNEFKVFRDEFF